MVMSWSTPSSCPPLANDEAHVWRVSLGACVSSIDNLESVLSDEEKAKSKLIGSKIYRRFVISRGLLRHILSKYLNMCPLSLTFDYSAQGKPSINSKEIHFNISHSHDLIVFAVTKNCSIGIDIEYKRQIRDFQKMCYRFMAPAECNEIFNSLAHEQLSIFYDLWVKKEAYIKALDGRLFDKLADFKKRDIHIDRQKQVNFYPFLIEDDYAAVLAALSELKSILYLHWPIEFLS